MRNVRKSIIFVKKTSSTSSDLQDVEEIFKHVSQSCGSGMLHESNAYADKTNDVSISQRKLLSNSSFEIPVDTCAATHSQTETVSDIFDDNSVGSVRCL